MKRPLLVYADTSVFGGAIDGEFRALSESFFSRVRDGDIELVVSFVVLDELEGAPAEVRRFFRALAPHIRRVGVDAAAYALQEAYIEAQVVGPALGSGCTSRGGSHSDRLPGHRELEFPAYRELPPDFVV